MKRTEIQIVNYLRQALLRSSIATLVFTIGSFIMLSTPTPAAFAINKSEPAPEFSLPLQNGQTVSLSDYRGKVIYLDFWASWCGPCRHTLPWMQKLQQKYRARGLEVLAINLDTKMEDAKKLLEGMEPSFSVLYDSAGLVAKKYHLPSMPSSFLVDRDGNVSEIYAGFRDGDPDIIEAQIEKLLNVRE